MESKEKEELTKMLQLINESWTSYYKTREEMAIRGSGMGPPNHMVLRKETYENLMNNFKKLLMFLQGA